MGQSPIPPRTLPDALLAESITWITTTEAAERLAVRSGKSKTAVLPAALEAYEADTVGAELDEVLADVQRDVHARIRPGHLGRQPSRDEIELELGMP